MDSVFHSTTGEWNGRYFYKLSRRTDVGGWSAVRQATTMVSEPPETHHRGPATFDCDMSDAIRPARAGPNMIGYA